MVRSRRLQPNSGGPSINSTGNPSPPREREDHAVENVPPPPPAPVQPDLQPNIVRLEGAIRDLIQEIRQPARAVPAVAPEPIPPPPPPVAVRREARVAAPMERDAPFANEPEFRALRKSFLELQPSSFYGTIETAVAEMWLSEVKKAFRSIQCPERYRVELLYPLLKDEASYWWDSVERSYPIEHLISWEEFLREFRNRHCSDADRREKVKEFFSLEQGSTTVRDFESRFHSLSRWVPEHVDTEEKKMNFFIQALHPDIKAWVTVTRPQSYQELIRCALDAESAEAEKKAYRTSQSNRSSPSSRIALRSGRLDTSSRQFTQANSSRLTSSIEPARSAASRPTLICYRCGEAGHMRRDCRVNLSRPHEQSTPSQSVQPPRSIIASHQRPPLPPSPPPKRQATSGRVFAVGSTSELESSKRDEEIAQGKRPM